MLKCFCTNIYIYLYGNKNEHLFKKPESKKAQQQQQIISIYIIKKNVRVIQGNNKKKHVKGIYYILIWILYFMVVVGWHGTKHISYFIFCFSFDLHEINKVYPFELRFEAFMFHN